MFEHHRDLSGWAVAPIALAPLLLSLTAFTDADALRVPRSAPTVPSVAEVLTRAEALRYDLDQIDGYYQREIEPIEEILGPYHADKLWVRRVAMTLVKEGHAVGVDPRVLASVVLVENPMLDPGIRSSQGAVGLMQVMPFHAGRWDCVSEDLTDPDTNVCHGAHIFKHDLERANGDIDRALLAYNGCVRGINTPDCHLYPTQVYSNAGRVALRSWLTEQH
jgi:soluble lytic murein transglycosylase-like protein